MRIRKLELTYLNKKVNIDFRNEHRMASSAIAIVGNDQSGKTVSQQFAMKAFQSSVSNNKNMRIMSKGFDGMIEFEYAQEIHSAVMRDGVLTQKLTTSPMVIDKQRVVDGCLFYGPLLAFESLEDHHSSIGCSTAHMLMRDFYHNEIKNCMIWIDDFDLGLDQENVMELLKSLLRKCIERDNQLIVSTNRKESVALLGDSAARFLVSDTKMIIDIMKQYSEKH